MRTILVYLHERTIRNRLARTSLLRTYKTDYPTPSGGGDTYKSPSPNPARIGGKNLIVSEKRQTNLEYRARAAVEHESSTNTRRSQFIV